MRINHDTQSVTFDREESFRGQSRTFTRESLEEALEEIKIGSPVPWTPRILFHGDIVKLDTGQIGVVLGRSTIANRLYDREYPSFRVGDKVRVLSTDGNSYTRPESDLEILSSPDYRKFLTVVA